MERIPVWCFLVGLVFMADACRPYAPDFAKSVVVPVVKAVVYVFFDVDLRG